MSQINYKIKYLLSSILMLFMWMQVSAQITVTFEDPLGSTHWECAGVKRPLNVRLSTAPGEAYTINYTRDGVPQTAENIQGTDNYSLQLEYEQTSTIVLTGVASNSYIYSLSGGMSYTVNILERPNATLPPSTVYACQGVAASIDVARITPAYGAPDNWTVTYKIDGANETTTPLLTGATENIDLGVLAPGDHTFQITGMSFTYNTLSKTCTNIEISTFPAAATITVVPTPAGMVTAYGADPGSGVSPSVPALGADVICNGATAYLRITQNNILSGHTWSVIVNGTTVATGLPYDQLFFNYNEALTANTTFAVQIKDETANCISASYSAAVNVAPVLSATIAPVPALHAGVYYVCGDDDAVFTVTRNDVTTGVTPSPYTNWSFSYRVNAGAISTVDNITVNNATLTIPNAQLANNTNYTVEIVSIRDYGFTGSATYCESALAGVTYAFQKKADPTANISLSATEVCEDASFSITATLTAGTPTNWEFDYEFRKAGSLVGLSATATANASPFTQSGVLAPTYGDLTVVVTRIKDLATGCESSGDLASANIKVNPKPTVSIVPVNAAICDGENGKYTITRTDPLYTTGNWTFTYQLYKDNVPEGTLQARTASASSFSLDLGALATQGSPLADTDYHIEVTSITDATSGCVNSVVSPSPAITVHALPTVTLRAEHATGPVNDIVIGGTYYKCNSQNIEVRLLTDGADTDVTVHYTITQNGNPFATGSVNSNNRGLSGNRGDLYNLDYLAGDVNYTEYIITANRAVSISTGCETTYTTGNTMIIRVYPNPTVEVTAMPTEVCADGSTTITVTRTDLGNTGNWSFAYTHTGGAAAGTPSTSVNNISTPTWTWIITDLTGVNPVNGLQFTVNSVTNHNAVSTGTSSACATTTSSELATPVKVNPLPEVLSIAVDNNNICEQEEIILNYTIVRKEQYTNEVLTNWKFNYRVMQGASTIVSGNNIAADDQTFTFPVTIPSSVTSNGTPLTIQITNITDGITSCSNYTTSAPYTGTPTVAVNPIPEVTAFTLSTSKVCADANTVTVNVTSNISNFTAYLKVTRAGAANPVYDAFPVTSGGTSITLPYVSDDSPVSTYTLKIDSIKNNVSPYCKTILPNTAMYRKSLEVIPTPAVEILTSDTKVCADGSITFTVGRTDFGSTDSWTFDASLVGITATSTDGLTTSATTITVTGANTKTFTLTDVTPIGAATTGGLKVTDVVNNTTPSCSNSAVVQETVTLNRRPVITSIAPVTTSICASGGDITYSITRSSLTNDDHSSWTVAYRIMSGAPAQITTGTVALSGTTNTFVVTIPAETAVGQYGGSLIIELTGVTDNLSGCTAVTTSLPTATSTTVNELPNATFTANTGTSDINLCADPATASTYTVALVVTASDLTTPATDNWEAKMNVYDGTNTTPLTFNKTNATINQQLPYLGSGDYTEYTLTLVSVKNLTTGCEQTYTIPQTLKVRSYPVPQITITPDITDVCVGGSVIYTITRTDGGNTTNWSFDWTAPGATVTSDTQSGVSGPSANVTVSGIPASFAGFSVSNIINTAGNTCTNAGPVTNTAVTVHAIPVVTVANGGVIDVCEGEPTSTPHVIYTIARTDTDPTGVAHYADWTYTYRIVDGNGLEVVAPVTISNVSGASVSLPINFSGTSGATALARQRVLEVISVTNNVYGTGAACDNTTAVQDPSPINYHDTPALTIHSLSADHVCVGGGNTIDVNYNRTDSEKDNQFIIHYTLNGVADVTSPQGTATGHFELTIYRHSTLKITKIEDIITGCYTELTGAQYEYDIRMATIDVSTDLNPVIACVGEDITVTMVADEKTPGTTRYGWTVTTTPSVGLDMGFPVYSGTPEASIPTFTTKNATNRPIVATVTITPYIETSLGNGVYDCPGNPVTKTITVNPKPELDVTSAALAVDYVMCHNTNTIAIPWWTNNTATNFHTITWTVSETFGGALAGGTDSNFPAVTLTNTTSTPKQAVVTATLSYTNAGLTCDSIVEFTITVNPEPKIDAVQDIEICSGEDLEVDFVSGTAVFTEVRWEVMSGSDVIIGLPTIGDVQTTTDEIDLTLTNQTGAIQIANIKATPYYINVLDNAVECTGTPITFEVKVNPEPILADLADEVICEAGDVNRQLTGSGITYYEVEVLESDFPAIAPVGTGSDIPEGGYLTYLGLENKPAVGDNGEAKRIVVKLTPVWVGNPNCPGTPKTLYIYVLPKPTTSHEAYALTFCAGDNFPMDVTPALTGAQPDGYHFWGNTANTGDSKTTYEWVRTSSDDIGATGLAAEAGDDVVPAFTTKNAEGRPLKADYKVKPTYYYTDNTRTPAVTVDCEGNEQGFSITVNPKPVIVDIVKEFVFENGTIGAAIPAFHATPATGTEFEWNIANAANATAMGMHATTGKGATMPTFDATNTTNAPISVDVVVEASYGSCPAADDKTFKVTVLPTAKVTPFSDIEVCSGTAINEALTATTAAAETSFKWERTNNVNVGLPVTGTGNIAGTALNTGLTPLTAEYKVTPVYEYSNANGTTTYAEGTPYPFKVTVYNAPVVDPVSSIVVKHGEQAIVHFSTTALNATYTWTQTNYATTKVGLLKSTGNEDKLDFTAKNTGDTTLKGEFTVTAAYPNNNGHVCSATNVLFSIHVLPIARITNTSELANMVMCGSDADKVVTLVSNTAALNTTYTMTKVSGDDITYVLAGNVLTVKSTTSSLVPLKGRYKLVPTFTDQSTAAEGEAYEFDITVNPKPVIDALANKVFIHGENTTPISISGNITTGATYSWKKAADGNDLGFGNPASGTAFISGFTAKNITDNTVTTTVTASAVANNCNADDVTFTISVLPIPTVDVANLAPQKYCVGDAVSALAFTGTTDATKTTYEWSMTYATEIGLTVSSGNNTIPGFTAVNAGNTPIVAVVEVTPKFTDLGRTSVGEKKTFTITVNPQPVINEITLGGLYCNNSSIEPYTFTSNIPNATFKWNRKGNTDAFLSIPATGEGQFGRFVLTNDGNVVVEATYEVQAFFENGCPSAKKDFTIRVAPTPVVNEVHAITTFHGESVTVPPFTGSKQDKFTWKWISGANIGTAMSGDGDMPVFTATNTTDAPVTATFEVTPSIEGCEGTSKSFVITVNPDFNFTLAQDNYDVDYMNLQDVIVTYVVKNDNNPVHLSVDFNPAAETVNFRDIPETVVPQDGSFTIVVPTNVPVGIYNADVKVRQGNNRKSYPITLAVNAKVEIAGNEWSGNDVEILDCSVNDVVIDVTATSTATSITIENLRTKTKTTGAHYSENLLAGTYPIEVTVVLPTVVRTYTFSVVKRADFSTLVLKRFNGNTLSVINNNPAQTGFAEAFASYQWYSSDFENGEYQAIPGATGQSYSAGSAGQSLPAEKWYYVEIITENGHIVRTCPGTVGNAIMPSVVAKAYPNPLSSADVLTVETEGAIGSEIEVYSYSGNLVGKVPVTGEATQITILRDMPKGTYILKVKGVDKIVNSEIKVIVK